MSTSSQSMTHDLADIFDDSCTYVSTKTQHAFVAVKADVAKPMADSYTKRGVLVAGLMGAGAALASIA